MVLKIKCTRKVLILSNCLNRPLVVRLPMIRGWSNPGVLYYLHYSRFMTRTAILVDGGFYRKRASFLWGIKTAEQRAQELTAYCQSHLHDMDGNECRQLFRIFYYDCEPVGRRSVFHPLQKKEY